MNTPLGGGGTAGAMARKWSRCTMKRTLLQLFGHWGSSARLTQTRRTRWPKKTATTMFTYLTEAGYAMKPGESAKAKLGSYAAARNRKALCPSSQSKSQRPAVTSSHFAPHLCAAVFHPSFPLYLRFCHLWTIHACCCMKVGGHMNFASKSTCDSFTCTLSRMPTESRAQLSKGSIFWDNGAIRGQVVPQMMRKG